MAPVYRPRAADVWSLGIVLINMYVPYVMFILQHFLLVFSYSAGSSLTHILPGSIIATLGRTQSRVVAPPSISIFPIGPTFSCGDSPV